MGRPAKVQKALRTYRENNPYCVVCGTDKNLSVHHLVEYSLGGSTDENNLVTLCRECHNLVEQGKIQISRYL